MPQGSANENGGDIHPLAFAVASRPRTRPRIPLKPLASGILAALLILGTAPACIAQAAQTQEQTFDIPAGPLDGALSKLTAQLGILFAVDARLTEGKRSAGLHGRYATHAAFERLLEGTGLVLVEEKPHYTLRAENTPPPVIALPDQVLPPVSVAAVHDRAPYQAAHTRSATRTDTPLQELPQSLTPINRELIDDLSIQSMAELIRYVPGISAAQGEGNRDTPVFRGTSSTADFLFDGIRDDMQYYRDFYNIERVEVMRGPNGMLLGHGGPGGVINRVGKTPAWADQGSLSLQTGSWDNKRLALDLERVLNADTSLRLNAMTENSGGYRDFFKLRRSGINPVLGWRSSSGLNVTLGLEHFEDVRTADRGIPSYMGRPFATAPSTFFGNPDLSVSNITLNAIDLTISNDLGGGWNLRNHTRRASYDKFFQNVFPGAIRQNGAVQEVSLLAHNGRTTRTNTFNQTDLTLSTSTGSIEHTLLAGMEIGLQDGTNRRESGYFNGSTPMIYVPTAAPQSYTPVTFQTRAGDPNSSGVMRVAAFYAQDQMRFSPHWLAIVGLRHDSLAVDMQDRQSGQSLSSRDRLWSPRVGLIYQPAQPLSLYANYAVGYQPRAGEQYISLTLNNQALKPEQFVSREIGAKWTVRPNLDATAALYQLDRQNVAIADPASSTQQLILVDGQRTRGLELSLGGKLTSRWKVLGAYAWQDSRLLTDQSPVVRAGALMPHVPRHSGALWNRYQLDERWGLGLGMSYRGAVYTSADDTVTLPAYWRWDAAVYFFPRPAVRVQLNVENLFNKGYYAYAHSNNNITPGSPRALRLSLEFSF